MRDPGVLSLQFKEEIATRGFAAFVGTVLRISQVQAIWVARDGDLLAWVYTLIVRRDKAVRARVYDAELQLLAACPALTIDFHTVVIDPRDTPPDGNSTAQAPDVTSDSVTREFPSGSSAPRGERRDGNSTLLELLVRVVAPDLTQLYARAYGSRP